MRLTPAFAAAALAADKMAERIGGEPQVAVLVIAMASTSGA